MLYPSRTLFGYTENQRKLSIPPNFFLFFSFYFLPLFFAFFSTDKVREKYITPNVQNCYWVLVTYLAFLYNLTKFYQYVGCVVAESFNIFRFESRVFYYSNIYSVTLQAKLNRIRFRGSTTGNFLNYWEMNACVCAWMQGEDRVLWDAPWWKPAQKGLINIYDLKYSPIRSNVSFAISAC